MRTTGCSFSVPRRIAAALFALILVLTALVATTLGVGTKASAENNGVGQRPAMGWSSWSYIRHNPTASNIEAQASALKNSGLAALGYTYANVDDFWYVCPGSQGPDVDHYGRWVTDTNKFPNSGATNGIQVVANYVHSLGLQFGLYVTPGISKQAVAKNTPIEGTQYHADDIATTAAENNYNCGGMVGIDYTKPGAQEFINSWANELASWGVDYLKLDGVGTWDVGDVKAWSQGLQQTGRAIHLELSNSLDINSASTWQQYSNGWRTGGDVECYCGANGSVYPLTNWSNVSARFDQAANWQPYGDPGGWNDYDSVEVGNGSNDGLTAPERQTVLSLWALASSPLLLGTDLTNLDPTDLGYLRNAAVIAVDQDGVDAARFASTPTSQIFAKRETNGAFIIGLFNTNTSASANVSVSLLALGLYGTANLTDLWSGASLGTVTGSYTAANVPAGGVALIKAVPASGSGGTGGLVGTGSGRCLDVYANDTNPGSSIDVWDCNGGSNQQWTPTSAHELRVYGSTECLDVYNNQTAPGTKVELWPCNGGANQKWTVNSDGTIVGEQSGLCLDVAGAGTANGSVVDIWTCNGQSNQQWSGLTPTSTKTYEAESSSNTLAGGAAVTSCSACSGGQKVGWIGNSGTLTFNGVSASSTGSHQVVIGYCDGDSGRDAYISVDGGTPQLVSFPSTGGWTTPGYLTLSLNLSAGANTIEFSNPSAWAPDLDKLDVVG